MDLKTIKSRINNMPHDIRAEVMLTMFYEAYLTADDHMMVARKGQSKRPFRKDVLHAEITDYDADAMLTMEVSRDGMYDMLPEGLFHSSRDDSSKKTVGEMTDGYRVRKKEEQDARRFFMPFENAFFLQAVRQEKQEMDMLFEINGSKPLNFFYELWGISRKIPPVLATKLMALLPYAYRITGDLETTAACLSYMLQEPVQVEKLGYREQSDGGERVSLGDCTLGVDMISGSFYMDYSLHLEFRIGPLEHSTIDEYIHGAGRADFITEFYEHFLPMEVDVKTTLLLPEHAEVFDFSKRAPILGYTTRI